MSSIPSGVLEPRASFFEKRGHAFLLILGREQRMKQAPLEADAFGERNLEGAIHGFLADQDARKRHFRDGLSDLQRFVQEALLRNDSRHQATSLGFLSIHHPAGQAHLGRLRLAYNARETLASSH